MAARSEPSQTLIGENENNPIILSRFSRLRPTSLDISTRPEDVLVATYPRSGTTWTIEIVRQLHLLHITDTRHTLHQQRHKGGVFLTPHVEQADIDIESPRILKTHDYYTDLFYLPKNSQAKIIFVIRQPKDTVSSICHHTVQRGVQSQTFSEFLSRQLTRPRYNSEGTPQAFQGPGNWWDFNEEYLENRDQHNILYLGYEDMRADTAGAIQKINKFLGYAELHHSEVEELVEKTRHDVMRQTHRAVALSRTSAGVREQIGKEEMRKLDEFTRAWLFKNRETIHKNGLDLSAYCN